MINILEELSTSVISYVITTNIKFTDIDLLVLAEYLTIKDNLIGLKFIYNRGNKRIFKGQFKDDNRDGFFNQLTLLINRDNTSYKIKLFIGGKIHICGLKNENIIDDIISDIFSIINIEFNSNIKTYIYNKQIVDEKGYVYDNNMKLIGFHEIILKYDKNGYEIRPFKFKINNIENIQVVSKDIILLNKKFKIGHCVDKEKLYSILLNYNYRVYYEPLIYHGLKIFYYINDEYSSDGICYCTTENIKNKCTCRRVTIIVFSNGSILLYGSNNNNDCEIIYNWLISMFTVKKQEVLII